MTRSLKTMTIALLTVFFANAAESQPLPGQIVVDPDNPAWLMHEGGGPYFLASPGDPEGFLYRGSLNADGTRAGDQNEIIDKLIGTGANGIYFQVIRSHGGDGNSTHNPFVNNDPSQGINHDVLNQWASWFDRMDANGITIYLFFYDDSSRIWNTGDSVGVDEEAFFSAVVDRFEGYRHLVWVVGEEYQERYSADRVSALASIIRAVDDHDHPIGVHKLNGLSFDEFANDPNIDQFAIQYNETDAAALNSGMNTAWANAAGRYNLNMSEATQWGTGTEARRKAWAVAMGGAYVMGLGMDIASTPLSDLEDLGRLRTFMESTNFHIMEPANGIATADTDYVLAARGQSYIAYAAGSTGELGLLGLTAGTYELRWFDPQTGETVVQQTDVVTDGEGAWTKPTGFGDEVALFLTRSGNATKPRPPANLTAD